MTTNAHEVFLSFSHQNRNEAKRLFEHLRNAGITVWMDKESLSAGENWRKTIRDKIRSTPMFLPLFSGVNLRKDSFFLQEIELALEIVKNEPEIGLKIVPVRLEDSMEPSQELDDFHCIDLFPSWDDGFSRLMRVFVAQKKATRNLEIVGFDLGHGETAVACTQLHVTTEPRAQDIINGQYSILTAVAITPDRGILIGDEAFEVQGTEALHISFKGRNIKDPAVGEPLQIFVRKCLDLLYTQGKLRFDDDTYFFVGRPSGWTEEEGNAYENLLRNAGMKNVLVRPESRAAFLDARETGALTQGNNKFPNSVLIIDIGSSTTDFTWVTHGEKGLEDVPLDFGHNQLGGGLIDEALFSYVSDSIPDNRAEAVRVLVNQPPIRARCIIECRRVKEKYFSKGANTSLEACLTEGSVRLKNRHYFFVEVSKDDMDRVLDTPLHELGGQTWPVGFRKELIKCKQKLTGNPPELVLLTGGGSRMTFTHNVCAEEFPMASVRVGLEPHLTIAKGLALLGRTDFQIEAFREEARDFVSSPRLRNVISEQLPELAGLIAQRLSTEIETLVTEQIRLWSSSKIPTLSELKDIMVKELNVIFKRYPATYFASDIEIWLEKLNQSLKKETYEMCRKYKIPNDSIMIIEYKPELFPTAPDFTEIFSEMIVTRIISSISPIFSVLQPVYIYLLLITHIMGMGEAQKLSNEEGINKLYLDHIRKWDIPKIIRVFLNKGEAGIRLTISSVKDNVNITIKRDLEKQLLSNEQFNKIVKLVRERLDKAADQAALVIRQRAT